MDTQIYSYRKVPFKELLFSQKLEVLLNINNYIC